MLQLFVPLSFCPLFTPQLQMLQLALSSPAFSTEKNWHTKDCDLNSKLAAISRYIKKWYLFVKDT